MEKGATFACCVTVDRVFSLPYMPAQTFVLVLTLINQGDLTYDPCMKKDEQMVTANPA